MKVLIAASEATPYAKTGGLADVAGSLLRELTAMHVDARLALPLYRGVKGHFQPEDTGHELRIPLGRDVYVGRVFLHEGHTVLIECNEFYDRKGLYGTPHGEYEDNALRFIFFSRAVLEACAALGFAPDVVHCNDWHTGLVPLYMKSIYRRHFGHAASLFTIHNLEYQGKFPASAMTLTGLGMETFNPEVLEYYGQMNLMKAGIAVADAVSTVSATYAKEIQGADYGAGLEGLLKKRSGDLYGIANGIDYAEWDPASDVHIRSNFDRENVSGKKRCKAALAERCAFSRKTAPIAAMVGRLSSQKGIDIFLGAAEGLLEDGVNIVILGEGEERLHVKLRRLAEQHHGKVSLSIGFDNGFAHQIFAGADMLLMPSRYEPCGLTQMIAMRYGTVPVARATGGLIDTVEDYSPVAGKGTGFLFADYTAAALRGCVRRALCCYVDRPRWAKVVRACMSRDFSWKASAREYVSLYKALSSRAAA